MSSIQQRISERLKPVDEERKSYTLFLKESIILQLDRIAKTMTKVSGQKINRVQLIDDAIDAYIEEALRTFTEQGIALESITSKPVQDTLSSFDTVVYPSHDDGFRKVFLGEKKWYYVRANRSKIPFVKYLAIYIGAPYSRITHYARVAENGFLLDEEKQKYIVFLEGEPIALEHPVVLGSTPPAATRAPRYTTLEKLLSAQEIKDL